MHGSDNDDEENHDENGDDYGEDKFSLLCSENCHEKRKYTKPLQKERAATPAPQIKVVVKSPS